MKASQSVSVVSAQAGFLRPYLESTLACWGRSQAEARLYLPAPHFQSPGVVVWKSHTPKCRQKSFNALLATALSLFIPSPNSHLPYVTQVAGAFTYSPAKGLCLLYREGAGRSPPAQCCDPSQGLTFRQVPFPKSLLFLVPMTFDSMPRSGLGP